MRVKDVTPFDNFDLNTSERLEIIRRYSCIVYEGKTKDFARTWTFQHKCGRFYLLLGSLPGFTEPFPSIDYEESTDRSSELLSS